MKLLRSIRAEYSFTPENGLPLECSLFRLICLTIALITFLVLIPANFLQDISPLANIPIAFQGVMSLAIYRSALRGRHHFKTMLASLLLTVNASWFFSGGNDGSTPYFILPICIYPLIFFRGWKSGLYMLGVVANGCLLLAVAHGYPTLVIPYKNAFDRTVDLMVGLVICSLSIILVMWVVLRTYLREQERLKELNLELAHEINDRMHTEHDLLQSNSVLAATEEKLRGQLVETIAAKDALLRSERRYGELVEHVNCIILRMTPTGRITFVNEYAEMFFGYDRSEMIGASLSSILDPGPGSGERHADADPFQPHDGECVCRDGRRAWISWSTKSMGNAPGQITEVLCVGQDVTERRQLQQQSMQRQKLESIGLLAGGIAHDFNNLLTPIMGSADLIMAGVPHHDPVHKRASSISAAAEKAAELVSQIMGFSTRQAIDAKRHDLNEIVTRFMGILRRTIRESIDIRYEPCAGQCPVLVNRTRIEQILLNLAVNAQDAIAGTGAITIRTGRPVPEDGVGKGNGSKGRYVVLTFGDNGSGMEDTVIGQIFDPFFTTKPAGQGTGLGLSTVYGVVQQHGGHIEVESSKGSGTVFRIFLPEAGAVENAVCRTVEASGRVPAATGTVLLVEDNPMVLEIARDLLTSQGLTVLFADDPDSAMALARENRSPIDLLVSDVVMPRMNGPELYVRLLERQPRLKVLFMSGYADKVPLVEDKGSGEVGFIAKPFTADSFHESVSQLLATSPCPPA